MTKDKRTYDVLIDVWNKAEPYFRFTLPKFSRGFLGKHDPWRVAPDDKKQSVHVLAGTRQSLVGVFNNSICIGSPSGASKKYGALLSILMLIPAILLGWVGVLAAEGGDIGVAIIPFFAFIFTCLFISWTLRNWLCTPLDWPIIFNRKARNVTYALVARPPFWRFWSTNIDQKFRTASWDDVRVRSYKYIQGTTGGHSFHDSYSLLLLWGGEGGDPQALSHYVGIGYQGYFEDELMWMLWEHIRRYMEEDGPAVPHGETLRPPTSGKPIVYPHDVITAAGGPPLSKAEVDKLAAAAPGPED